MAVLGALGRRSGRFRRLPLAGGWTAARDLAAPQGPDVPEPVVPAGTVMSAAREQIVSRIREALGRGPLSPDREAQLDARLSEPRDPVIPARGRVEGRDRITAFCDEAARVGTTVERVPSAAAVPGAIAAYLALHRPADGYPPGSPNPFLEDLAWSEHAALTPSAGPARTDRRGQRDRRRGRRRRDRYPGLGVRPGKPDDVELPARYPYRGVTRRRHRRGLRGDVDRRPGGGTAPCPGSSTGSPGRRAPPTSNKPCSSASTGRVANTSY